MRRVFVIGVGMTKFGKFPDMRAEELGRSAVLDAIKDARIPMDRIGFAYCGHTRLGSCGGQRVLAELGLTGIEVFNVENACASGSSAFRGVYLGIATGQYDMGIAIGIEQMSKVIKGVIPPREDDLEGGLGRVMPSVFAMVGRRHMEEYGTTLEQLALISVKNHHYGCLNPRSQYQKEFTVEEVLSSRMICDPITLLQCCPTGDGAAAAILCTEELAKKYSKEEPIRVMASMLKSGFYRDHDQDITSNRITVESASEAYRQAGIKGKDIDLCELHDCFTVAELVHYENFGFCKKGEGGKMIEEGRSGLDGEVAVNPSGGLLAKGHPLGATGVAQVAEVVWQLRDKAGERQVKKAKVGMAHTMGGGVTGVEAGACSIHILGK